jgi:hypothetical protein
VNEVAHAADTRRHHPYIEFGWGYCRIRYQTHAIGGLHEKDLACAPYLLTAMSPWRSDVRVRGEHAAVIRQSNYRRAGGIRNEGEYKWNL